MIPESPIFIIGDDNNRILSIRAAQYIIDELHGMAFTVLNIRITRMFVIDTQGFYKRNTRKGTVFGIRYELRLIFQVVFFCLCSIRIISKINEGLVVKLESGIRTTSKGIVPATGIPCPGYFLFTQPVANGWYCLVWYQVSNWCSSRMRMCSRKN